jgi:hypothetical protein
MSKISWALFTLLLTIAFSYSQNSLIFSSLLNLNLPDQFIKENNTFSIFAGKALLELETGPQSISIDEVEIFTWKNPQKNPADSEQMLNAVLNSIRQAGWQVTPSPKDQHYRWLVRNQNFLLGYFTASKKETGVYIGKTSAVPSFVKTSAVQTEPENPEFTPTQLKRDLTNSYISSTEIVGTWGDLKSSQINYYDPNGMMIGSGLSKGYGFEFKSDRSYAQSFLATSSFPNYKIFIYTTGTYTITGDQLILIPGDRHYRKWESEVLTTDEHSRPEREQYTWTKRKNNNTAKTCLYLIRSGESEEREYCQE